MRSAGVLLIATLILSGCTGALSSEIALASPSQSPLITPSPSLAPSLAPSPSRTPSHHAISGLRLDDVLADWQAFGLTCEDGLSPAGFPLPNGLIGAQCQRHDPASKATLTVLINHWPDGSVLTMEALSHSLDPSSDMSTSSLLRHIATTEYEGSDRETAKAWLEANLGDECGQGCYLTIGAAKWFHAVGVEHSDQISLGPAD